MRSVSDSSAITDQCVPSPRPSEHRPPSSEARGRARPTATPTSERVSVCGPGPREKERTVLDSRMTSEARQADTRFYADSLEHRRRTVRPRRPTVPLTISVHSLAPVCAPVRSSVGAWSWGRAVAELPVRHVSLLDSAQCTPESHGGLVELEALSCLSAPCASLGSIGKRRGRWRRRGRAQGAGRVLR